MIGMGNIVLENIITEMKNMALEKIILGEVRGEECMETLCEAGSGYTYSRPSIMNEDEKRRNDDL